MWAIDYKIYIAVKSASTTTIELRNTERMAIQLPDNIFVATNAPLDVRYGPYVAADIAAAKTLIDSTISLGNRYEGLTVGIILGSAPDPIVEYWFYGGVDVTTNLVEKSSGG